MALLITGTVLSIILFFVIKNNFVQLMFDSDFDTSKKKTSLGALVSIVTLLITVLISSISIVPANNVGVKFDPFTGVSSKTMSEGVYFVNPLAKVYKISTEIQSSFVKDLTTQTRDAQYLTNQFDIKYKVDEKNAFIVFKNFKTVENLNKSLLSPTIQRAVESVVTKYNVMEFLGEKRTEVYSEINDLVSKELSFFGITFIAMTLVDSDAGKDIEAAIQSEAIAKKAVETAKQELLKVETEAKQKSVQAQADKDAAAIKAETMIISAKAEAEANKLVSDSITDNVLRQNIIDKWDSKLPNFIGGGESGFIVNSIIDPANSK